MTTANPAFDESTATSEAPAARTQRRGGKRFFMLVVLATAIGFVAARMRSRHHTSDMEDDYGD